MFNDMLCLRSWSNLLFFVMTATASFAGAKPGDPFKTVDEAALDALDYLAKQYPDWKKFEYGGCIYKEGDVFKASEPVTRYNPKRCEIPAAPPGTVMAGDYHNHTSREDFSPNVDLVTNNTWPIYLLTPSGQVKRHTFHDKKTVKLK